MKALPLIPGTEHFGEQIRAHRLGHKMTRGGFTVTQTASLTNGIGVSS